MFISEIMVKGGGALKNSTVSNLYVLTIYINEGGRILKSTHQFITAQYITITDFYFRAERFN